MIQTERIIAVRCIVEVLQRTLVASIAIVEEHPAVAGRGVDRLQGHEIGLEPNQPVLVARRLVDVHNVGLRRRRRIDREQHTARQPLVHSTVAKAVAASKWAPVVDADRKMAGHTPNPLQRLDGDLLPTVCASGFGGSRP